MNIRKTDMYGHEIWLLGETGYGMSISYGRREGESFKPEFTFFHASDGFRQALFTVHGSLAGFPEFDLSGPVITNVFRDRMIEVEKFLEAAQQVSS